MNLPQITAYIGSKQQKNQQPLEKLVKRPKVKLKENEQPYILFMTFDLNHDQIYFEQPLPYNELQPTEFQYFGNNSAAALQSYLVREVDSLHYLLTSVWNDLYLALKQQGMEESQLSQFILELQEHSLITLGSKKGNGTLSLNRIRFPSSDVTSVELKKKNKSLIIDGKEYKYESFIRWVQGNENKFNRFILLIPQIRRGEEEIILSQHPDYIQFVMKLNNLVSTNKEEESSAQGERVCYLCQQRKGDVSSQYSTKFSRAGINKIFTTTTINSSRYYPKGADYDDAYSLCRKCYQDLLAGEKVVEQRFRGTIARESAFILPEGVMESFDYDSLGKIKDQMDFAFHSSDANEWFNAVEADASWMEQNQFVVNFIIYRTDGNSVTVLDSFEDVPVLRFIQVMDLFRHYSRLIKPHVKGISLGSIYHMVPVRETDKGQIDVGRVLSLYKAILSGHQIDRETIYAYVSEALDKGLRQLMKSKMDNYKNLNLYQYQKREDFYIKRITMSYLVLMQTIQALNLPNKPFFLHIAEEGERMNVDDSRKGYQKSIEEMESFLGRQGFTDEAKALFYLGALVHRVAVAQYLKEHKTKPILKKIQFQGMNQIGILRLYEEVVEKLRQYNKMTLFAENLMNRFHYYHGPIQMKWPLSDHANVFYMMAGYSYMVGTKAPDLSKEEEISLQEMNKEGNE
ncbi:TM1802 family CRISPR-associated protein [Microaerobacter geothermalis]|uniref:TM1802 family CRISPR-associated protein n=1 Tax=Microaerobacter geothermalis TaxID=674972 RepID=UPI001F2BEAD3|nr:TM1802 family CRISPR-associated protein [Microaerobacter geothermalis]MCF6094006.1 TM1802 family CRISPR-associated protein [Microaerobacter geothermalis]